MSVNKKWVTLELGDDIFCEVEVEYNKTMTNEQLQSIALFKLKHALSKKRGINIGRVAYSLANLRSSDNETNKDSKINGVRRI